jgi:hypothetical protein
VVVDVPPPQVEFRQAPPVTVQAPAPACCAPHCLFHHRACVTYVQQAAPTFVSAMPAPMVSVPAPVQYAMPAPSFAMTPVAAAPVAAAPAVAYNMVPAANVALAAAPAPPPAAALPVIPVLPVLPVNGVPTGGGLPPPSQAIGTCGANMDLRTAVAVLRDALAAQQATQGCGNRAADTNAETPDDLSRRVDVLTRRVNKLVELVNIHDDQLQQMRNTKKDR